MPEELDSAWDTIFVISVGEERLRRALAFEAPLCVDDAEQVCKVDMCRLAQCTDDFLIVR